MPLIALAQDDGSDDKRNPLVASIDDVVTMRFGPSTVTRDVQYIIDPDRLLEILEIAVTAASLAEIKSAIESARPSPK